MRVFARCAREQAATIDGCYLRIKSEVDIGIAPQDAQWRWNSITILCRFFDERRPYLCSGTNSAAKQEMIDKAEANLAKAPPDSAASDFLAVVKRHNICYICFHVYMYICFRSYTVCIVSHVLLIGVLCGVYTKLFIHICTT